MPKQLPLENVTTQSYDRKYPHPICFAYAWGLHRGWRDHRHPLLLLG